MGSNPVTTQILMRSKQRKEKSIQPKNVPMYELKIHVFHKWSKHVVKVEFWRFLKKIEKP